MIHCLFPLSLSRSGKQRKRNKANKNEKHKTKKKSTLRNNKKSNNERKKEEIETVRKPAKNCMAFSMLSLAHKTSHV